MTVAQGVAHRGSRRAELWHSDPRMPARNTTYIVVGRTRCWGLCHRAVQAIIGRSKCSCHLAIRVCHSPGVCVRLWYQSFWSSDHAVSPWPCPLITAANPRSARRRQRLSTSQTSGLWSAANAACRLRDWRGLTKAATDVLVGIYCAFPSLSTRFRYSPKGDIEY